MDVSEKSSNGKRLIDANAMRADWLENGENEYVYDTNAVLDSIDSQPTVDAVEVIRCWECKYWGDEAGKLQHSDGVLFARCKAHNYLIDGRHTGWCPTENDFCSYGDWKGGSDND